MAYQRKWLSPRNIFDHVVSGAPGVRSLRDAEYGLFYAVMEGEVRARHSNGKPVGLEELNEWADQNRAREKFDLPPDIHLSVDDAERIWREDTNLGPEFHEGVAKTKEEIADNLAKQDALVQTRTPKQRKRKIDEAKATQRKIRYEMVLAKARRFWPDDTKRPSAQTMARKITGGEGKKFQELSVETISKLIEGTYTNGSKF